MKVLTYAPAERLAPSCVALGFFDGVHLGHRAIFNEALAVKGLQTITYTFQRHPKNTIAGHTVVPLLTDNTEKNGLLSAIGLDACVYDDFQRVRSLTAEEFFEQVLLKQLHAKHVVCGFNYRFGYCGVGDHNTLAELCAKHGVGLSVVQPVVIDGLTVSSSLIRSLLRQGEAERAAALLGRPYSLQRPVLYGKRLGRTLGLPTINQTFAEEALVPAFGVYATRTQVDGREYDSISNIGLRPTVDDRDLNCETHILDFDGDLYEKEICVSFFKRLRPEVRFSDLAALQQQVEKDKQTARQYFQEQNEKL